MTENTAIILDECGILTTYRGETFVKGAGYIKTYFVPLDDQFNLIKKEQSLDFYRTEDRQRYYTVRNTLLNDAASEYVFTEEDRKGSQSSLFSDILESRNATPSSIFYGEEEDRKQSQASLFSAGNEHRKESEGSIFSVRRPSQDIDSETASYKTDCSEETSVSKESVTLC